MSGSRDFGAQAFCAMLRSVGVEARLVCSLQALPFTGVARGMNAVEPKPMIVLSEDGQEDSGGLSAADTSSPASKSATSAAPTPPRMRRLGQPSFKNKPFHSPKGKQKLGKMIQNAGYSRVHEVLDVNICSRSFASGPSFAIPRILGGSVQRSSSEMDTSGPACDQNSS